MAGNKASSGSSSPRKRSLTSLTLNWLVERMRRTERVKDAIQKGHYKIDSEELAKSIVTKVS